MAKKTYCDRCLREIDTQSYTLTAFKETIDLCRDCYEEFQLFMQHKDK